MNIWHLTPDASRTPRRVSPGEEVHLRIGTWPIEPNQAVWVTCHVERAGGDCEKRRVDAAWQQNEGDNSYWQAELGSFEEGDRVFYTIHGRSPEGTVTGPAVEFTVGPKLYLAILWHQHQPIYKDTSHPTQTGSYLQPWVRLHAIRDYYSMAALVADYPDLHLTINLTPALLWQIEDYTDHGATDRALDLTRTSADMLTTDEREYVLSTFFDAHWHNQIFPHQRYLELFTQRRERRSFSIQDLRDLQMWFNLAWFGHEFRAGEVDLVTGDVVSVRRFVEQGRDFSHADIEAMIEEQYKIMRAVIPIHRHLQERGQIEVATTPFFHPILPLLADTDRATIDRPGATHPPRFAYPEDAEAQVQRAVDYYRHCFGRPPRGMWPAEGAVSQFVISHFARHGVRWIATDRGVLARSGRWGYDVDELDVVCRPYRAETNDYAVSVFFRDTQLSNAIGFHYHDYADYGEAAQEFVNTIKTQFAYPLAGDEDRALTVVLDGENAWGAYRQDARPFLHALYGLLARDTEVQTVTFGEYLDGNPARNIDPHPVDAQPRVYDLYTGSWIDELGSLPGVDLGTWIGEPEENRGWELLLRAREALDEADATPASAPAAFDALYVAEGSDWFWWFGDDQDSGNDDEFDDLFRIHLRNVYREVGVEPPAALDRHIVPHAVVWTFAHQIKQVQHQDRLRVRTNCPGVLTWWLNDSERHRDEMVPVGGVMAGVKRYHLTLGPFPAKADAVRFVFLCAHEECDGQGICPRERGTDVCRPDEYTVQVV